MAIPRYGRQRGATRPTSLTSTGGRVHAGGEMAAARADEAVNPQGGRHSDVKTQFDGYMRAINNRGRMVEAQGGKFNVDIRDALPGLRQTRPGAGQLSLGGGGGDQADYFLNQRLKSLGLMQAHEQVDAASQANRAGAFALDQGITDTHNQNVRRAFAPTEDFDLFSGRMGARTRAGGDIVRGEGMEDARSAARTYMDPTVRAGRQAEVADEERLLNARYGREADAMAKIEAARLAASSRENAARTTAGGALTREALKGLLKSRELQSLFGGQVSPEQEAGLEGLLMNYAGAGEAPQQVDDVSLNALIAGAAGGGPGADQLAGVWDQLSPGQQAVVRQRLGAGGGR